MSMPRHLASLDCRVACGMELVSEPDILLADEPTSGLDSFTALHLMRTLTQVCRGVGSHCCHDMAHGMLAAPTACLGQHAWAAHTAALQHVPAVVADWLSVLFPRRLPLLAGS